MIQGDAIYQNENTNITHPLSQLTGFPENTLMDGVCPSFPYCAQKHCRRRESTMQGIKRTTVISILVQESPPSQGIMGKARELS